MQETTSQSGFSQSTTQLQGGTLLVLRALVMFCAALSLIVFGLNLVLIPQLDLDALAHTGLAISAAPLPFAMAVVRSILLFAFSSFIVWKRPHDRVVLFVAASFFSLATLTLSNILLTMPASLAPMTPLWRGLAGFNVWSAMSSSSCVLLFLPNGRFTPRWSVFFIPLWVLYGTAHAFLFWSTGLYPDSIFKLTLVIVFINLSLQVHRYRQSASYQEKQQIKWIALGMGWAVVLQVAIASWFSPFAGDTSFSAVYFACVSLSYIVGIGGFALALIRYRLWDIDIALNRSLVYGSLFLGLLAIFGGGFWGLQASFVALLGSEHKTTSAVIAMGMAAGSFQPTLRWLRRFVDQKIFGVAIDYRQFARQRDAAFDDTPDMGSPPAAPARPQARLLLDTYTPRSTLGKGGMGEVTLALHKDTGQEVAIKQLLVERADKPEVRQRFAREAKILTQLNHPNIVRVLDYRDDDGKLYMVLEYIEGDDLSDIIDEIDGPLPLDAILPFLEEVAAALDYAHEQGVIHRDIKPSNVMMVRTKDAEATAPLSPTALPERYQRAVLMDFGIARTDSSHTHLTLDNKLLGTPQYIAPEQINGARHVDGRADIYSFGIMTYLLTTGTLPFPQEHLFTLMMAHISQPPKDPRQHTPALPRHAAKAILRALHKRPHGRFDTAAAFVQALKGAPIDLDETLDT